ncbi:hypothetical protein Npun_F2024 [Nostoc punctiforme PCC 73102]|uniref:Uncharacterized protein n=1 Tax=Nostoc punctiforme (strain ATCC 29133 / PCC 73102) TaxID=63737 RepID=B2J4Z1_NOSP7|nr:hypothetical protein Npun_F2024 [Nostoc punctiforme PCC 73102]
MGTNKQIRFTVLKGLIPMEMGKFNRLLGICGGRSKGERNEISPLPSPFNLSPTSCKSYFCKISNEQNTFKEDAEIVRREEKSSVSSSISLRYVNTSCFVHF